MTTPYTSSLFHYTKNFDDLKLLIENGLKLNYCKEKIGDLVIGIPMISFCDIPLSRASEHKNKYGSYAIGLSKEYFKRINAEQPIANSVMYVSNSMLEKSILEIKKMIDKSQSERKLPQTNDGLLSAVNYFNLLWDTMTNSFQRSYILGFIKPEFDKESGRSNYAEREWRLIMPECDRYEWKWSEKEYDEWRGDKSKPKPEINGNILHFTVNEISHIIVANDKDVKELVKHLTNDVSKIGDHNITTKDDIYLLISKITSFEQIERNY